MEFSVNMKQFKKNWVWNTDTVHYGDRIACETSGMMTADAQQWGNHATQERKAA
jgi:hypothetical protein